VNKDEHQEEQEELVSPDATGEKEPLIPRFVLQMPPQYGCCPK